MATLEQEGEEVVGQARCPFESRQSNVGLFAGEPGRLVCGLGVHAVDLCWEAGGMARNKRANDTFIKQAFEEKDRVQRQRRRQMVEANERRGRVRNKDPADSAGFDASRRPLWSQTSLWRTKRDRELVSADANSRRG